MNEVLKSDLVAGLRALYQSEEAARRLFDGFAARQKDSRVTPAARAVALTEAPFWEIVALFRKLDGLGAGAFKVGRRGAKTRIEWHFSVRSLGLAAQGAAGEPEAIDPTQVEEAEVEVSESDVPELDPSSRESEWIAHSFQLRPDLRLTIKLPVDLTDRESERIAGFIRQVPFDG